jgi:hypothetical protein
MLFKDEGAKPYASFNFFLFFSSGTVPYLSGSVAHSFFPVQYFGDPP